MAIEGGLLVVVAVIGLALWLVPIVAAVWLIRSVAEIKSILREMRDSQRGPMG